MAEKLRTLGHPLIQDKLSRLRDKATDTAAFGRLMREIGLLVAYEALRDLPLTQREIETPLERASLPVLRDGPPCLVSILRAGNGLMEALREVVPEAPVGHVGIYRDHKTLEAVEYFFKVPAEASRRTTFVIDPMLATGHSAIAALDRLKAIGLRDLRFLCLVAAPEGIAALSEAHPDVPIVTGAVDRGLNDKGYILPGLGDAGDRLYGTS